MATVRDALWSALDAAVEVVGAAAVEEAWESPSALAGLSVGALVAHLLVATERTAVVLGSPSPDPGSVTIVDVPTFYGPNRIDEAAQLDEGLPALLRADATARARSGPGAVVGEFLGLPARLAPLVDACPPDRLVPVVQVRGGAARLDDYLATRVVELVVHTDDLLCSVGGGGTGEPAIPPAALEVVTSVFLRLATARSGGRSVVRAFARRERAGDDVLRVL